jgi:hypothetical protein
VTGEGRAFQSAKTAVFMEASDSCHYGGEDGGGGVGAGSAHQEPSAPVPPVSRLWGFEASEGGAFLYQSLKTVISWISSENSAGSSKENNVSNWS